MTIEKKNKEREKERGREERKREREIELSKVGIKRPWDRRTNQTRPIRLVSLRRRETLPPDGQDNLNFPASGHAATRCDAV